LAIGFVFVLDLATQLVEGAHQFTGRVVLVTPMNRVVGVLDQQRRIHTGVVHLRELVGRQGRRKLPCLAPHGVITEATGELALGAAHLAVQVVALHVADHLAIQVQLVQMTAAVG
jgi:hypothetical protein